MGRNYYVLAKMPNPDKDSDEKLEFESVIGADSPELAQASREFHATKKGRELFKKLKDLELEVEAALKAWDRAENSQRKIQGEAAGDTFFRETHKSEIDAAAEKAFDAKSKYEACLWDQRRSWYSIEAVLGSWRKVRNLPGLIHNAKKELAIVEDRLKAAHENREYDVCGELAAKIEDLKFSIECWSTGFRETTGEDPPEPTVGESK